MEFPNPDSTLECSSSLPWKNQVIDATEYVLFEDSRSKPMETDHL
jgi:hypothetical protein